MSGDKLMAVQAEHTMGEIPEDTLRIPTLIGAIQRILDAMVSAGEWIQKYDQDLMGLVGDVYDGLEAVQQQLLVHGVWGEAAEGAPIVEPPHYRKGTDRRTEEGKKRSGRYPRKPKALSIDDQLELDREEVERGVAEAAVDDHRG